MNTNTFLTTFSIYFPFILTGCIFSQTTDTHIKY